MSYRQKNFIDLCLILLMSCMLIKTQAQNVSGVIYDGDSSEPLVGVNIVLKDTLYGTITDYDGKFVLDCDPASDTLILSYIGYATQTVPLNGQTDLSLRMYEENNELEKVVVMGYGTKKKKEVTGATGRISAEKITSTPILRVEQSLQGRMPGVQVTNLSGQPGEEPTVRIRGTGTTGNANPLYVVDGLPVAGIDYLNPGDIESIDVLKDAATAAIYGARAANGVVLITTKSGKRGKLNIAYSGYYGIQNAAKRMNMLGADDYRMLMNEGARNAGLTEPFNLSEASTHDTDWQDVLFQSNVPMQSHQISFSGGNDKSTFASSISYFTQEGVIGGPKSQFDRYTGRINSNHKINSFIRVGNNLAYTHLIRRGIASNQSFNGAFSSALNLDPLTPLFEDNEVILEEAPYATEPVVRDKDGRAYGISNFVGAEVVNPLALLEIDNDETRKDQLVGNIFGEIEPLKGLKLRTSYGVDLAYVLDDSHRPLFYLNGAQLNVEKTSVTKAINRYFTWQWENVLSYETIIKNNHRITALIGSTATEFKNEDISGFNTDVPITDPDHVYLNQATDTLWTAYGGAIHSALFSIFGRLNYNLNDKYTISAVLRRDGSSKFGANNRYGIFPSIGFAWLVSEEPFMRNIGLFDAFKVRASWGINGNQEIGDYQFLSIIDQGREYIFSTGNSVGSSPLYVENQDIKWEEAEQYNLGFDAGMFNNRLQVNLDFYIKNTNGLLERIPIPAHVGNDGPISNVGSVQNKGVELGINWRNIVGVWRYEFGLNGAYNKNKMTHIGNNEKVINGASWAIAGTVTRAEEGLPIAYFWGYKTDGIFQSQAEVYQHINKDGELLQEKAVAGDVRFVDVNDDGIIDEDDRTMIGNPIPDITFGFNGFTAYKNFDVSIFLQGTYGNDVFNGMQRQDLRYTNRPESALDRWTEPGTSNSTPRYTWIDVNNNYRVSDLYIEDGSHLRIKNIQLGYNFPSARLNNFNISNWRIFLSIENLFTFSRYSGVDPEIGALSSFDIGIDRAIYPQARTFRLGTNIAF